MEGRGDECGNMLGEAVARASQKLGFKEVEEEREGERSRLFKTWVSSQYTSERH